MSTPFRRPQFRGKSQGAAPATGPPVPAGSDLPDPVEYDTGMAAPSVAATGVSGTGKTHALAQLLQAGINMMVLDVEDKAQALIKYHPLIIPVGAPVRAPSGALRQPSPTDKYLRLQEFRARLETGHYREWKGRPIELIGTDGIMEIADVYIRHHKLNVPVSSSTGERNVRAMYERYGTEVIDYLAACKRAASSTASLYGSAPVGIYCTCGETRVKGDYDKVSYQLMVPGNMAKQAFPFQFEVVFHLSVRRAGDGSPIYVCHTVGEEGTFEAKCPSELFPPEIEGWDMGMIYKTLLAHYRGELLPGQESQESAGEPAQEV